MESALSNAIGVEVAVTDITVPDPNSVEVSFVFTVSSGARNIQRLVMSNVLRLQRGTSWLASVQASCQSLGGCAGGITFGSFVSIVTSESNTPPVATKAPVFERCGQGCLAGILIAVLVFAFSLALATFLIASRIRSKREKHWAAAKETVEEIEDFPDAAEDPNADAAVEMSPGPRAVVAEEEDADDPYPAAGHRELSREVGPPRRIGTGARWTHLGAGRQERRVAAADGHPY